MGGQEGERKSPLCSKLAIYLLDDIIEEAVGVLRFDLLLDEPVWGEVRDVDAVSRACATGEDSDNATIPREDDRPRVASIGKLAPRFAIGQDSNLNGGVLDPVFIVHARERLETVGATDGCSCGQPIFDDKEALLAMDIKVLGVSELTVLDDAVGLEVTIPGVPVVRLIGGVKEHCVPKVRARDVTA